jgi:hypothetical protein
MMDRVLKRVEMGKVSDRREVKFKSGTWLFRSLGASNKFDV